jgi:hypothetical protein
MTTVLGLVILGFAALALTARDLRRQGSEDVLRAVLLGETGALLGAMLGLFVPGGFFLGLIAGGALAATRFRELGRGRREAIEAELDRVGSPAEALLVLHDRVDELSGERSRRGMRALSWLALGAMGVGAAGAVVAGLVAGVVPLTIAGVAFSFPPIAALADLTVRQDEREFARRLLGRVEDTSLPAGHD